jgi:GT2 family glycosyltransferase
VNASTVSAVVVSYNVRDLLLACVASLVAAREAGELAEIVVVDNASSDDSVAAVRERFPDVRVIEAENRGYGAGANRGIADTTGDYVLILNPDTIIPLGTIGALAGYLDREAYVAVVGPLLRYPDGSIQSSRRRFPSRWTPLFESTIVEQVWPGNRFIRNYRMADEPLPAEGTAQRVDWVVGAALLVRRRAIDAVGGFDESFVMYSEEVEWCWRFRRHGWKVAWLPAVEIIHHEGASSVQDIPRRQAQFDISRVQLTRRIYGDRQAGLVRYGLLAGYLAQLAVEGAKWLLGHRRDLRAERVRLYWHGLRTGLLNREASA